MCVCVGMFPCVCLRVHEWCERACVRDACVPVCVCVPAYDNMNNTVSTTQCGQHGQYNTMWTTRSVQHNVDNTVSTTQCGQQSVQHSVDNTVSATQCAHFLTL